MNKHLPTLFLCGLLLAFPPAVLAGSATIADEGTNRYKAVRLTPEIYREASADLSDLRLFDGAGEPVAYFIHSGTQSPAIDTTETALRQIDAFEKDGQVYFDFEAVQDDPLTDPQATSVRFSALGEAFAKQATLYGSYDGIKWEQICRETLYRVDGNERLEIALPTPQKYSHYRIALDNNLERIDLPDGLLRYSAQVGESARLAGTLAPPFTVRQQEKQSILTLEGMRGLRIARLTLETPGMFRRWVETPLAGEELYQLRFGEVAYRALSLPQGGRRWAEETFEVVIENGDDKPLEVTGVQVEYEVDELIFEGTSGPYRLQFGEPLDPPAYDIVRYRAQVLAQPIDRLALDEIESGIVPASSERGIDLQTVFNGVIIAVTMLLGAVILLRIKRSEPNK